MNSRRVVRLWLLALLVGTAAWFGEPGWKVHLPVLVRQSP